MICNAQHWSSIYFSIPFMHRGCEPLHGHTMNLLTDKLEVMQFEFLWDSTTHSSVVFLSLSLFLHSLARALSLHNVSDQITIN